ncbi:DDE superfamily endonuclease [Vibrio sp. B1REV9]|uniref:transposase n=1 Tax=Vibrio sp. B1REV9 TaxID=2751179 RepID=UPI001AF3FE30|nr:DDE superfamily endonuclease [Vibrio sp. B1REV9]
MVVPWVSKAIMVEHLKQISAVTKRGHHAVAIMNVLANTPMILHKGSIISVSSNSPPYSPELNPIEQVWSWLNQHYLANQTLTIIGIL